MDDVVRDISFGIGRKSKNRVEHELFDDPAWQIKPIGNLKSMAAEQLGTVGGGNHYVDIFADEDDRIWVGVHFGSRGLGHKTATHFLKAAGGKDGMDVPPTVVDEKSEIGHDYLAGMHLAGRYAYAGREAVARHVVQNILGAREFSKKSTTITTSPGAKNMTAESFGSCAKAQRRRFPVKKVLSAAAWATTR